MVDRAAVWTTPITWEDDTPLDEDTLNEQVRNNLLFLKDGHLNIKRLSGVAPTTTSTTMALVDSAFEIALTLEAQANLFLGLCVPYSHSNASGLVTFDIYSATGGYYISSGTGTAATNGIFVGRPFTNNADRVFCRMIQLGYFSAGTHTYQLHWKASGATATIPTTTFPAQLWLWGN